MRKTHPFKFHMTSLEASSMILAKYSSINLSSNLMLGLYYLISKRDCFEALYPYSKSYVYSSMISSLKIHSLGFVPGIMLIGKEEYQEWSRNKKNNDRSFNHMCNFL